jgi:hypothetical protein
MNCIATMHIKIGLKYFALPRKQKLASWLSNYRIKLIVFVMLSAVFPLASAQTHCKAGDEIVFSCKIANSRKVVSLCATSKVIKGKKNAVTLQYRFGKLNGTPEFEFPSSKNGSLEQFKLYEYFRPELVSTSISFTNGVFDCVVNESEDQHGSSIKLAGVTALSRAKNKQLDLACETESIYSDWSIVSGVVPCEERGALNACQYK